MDCKEVQNKIVARREGWLSSKEAAELDEHAAACPVCRRHVEADSRLVAALAEIPGRTVTVPSWEQVAASHRRERTGPPRWWLAPALGAALASLGLLWLTVARPGHPAGSPGTDTPEALSEVAPATHLVLSASDVAADPNRVVLAASMMRSAR